MNNYVTLNFRVKAEGENGQFIAYGNVKNVVDKAGDVTTNGCFRKSIDNHLSKKTMPKMLLQHDKKAVIGVWLKMEEDNRGLKLTGQLCLETQVGRETYALIKMGALDSLSIGYLIIKEYFDKKSGVNYLEEIDVKEVSVVTFPDNETSLIEVVKSTLADGKKPTERELQKALQAFGFSKRKAESIINIGYKQTVNETFEQHYRLTSLLYQVDVGELTRVEDFLKSLVEVDQQKNDEVVEQLKSLNRLFH